MRTASVRHGHGEIIVRSSGPAWLRKASIVARGPLGGGIFDGVIGGYSLRRLRDELVRSRPRPEAEAIPLMHRGGYIVVNWGEGKCRIWHRGPRGGENGPTVSLDRLAAADLAGALGLVSNNRCHFEVEA